MTEIDWSKAPEGATHYLAQNNYFYRYKNGVLQSFLFDAWGESGLLKEYHVDLIPRTAQAWNGEGFPPVGIEIEVMHGTYGWIGAKVVGQDGSATIIRTNDGYAGVHPHEFRPIRTPEQIAAEMADQAIKEIAGIICRDGAFDIDDPEVNESAVALYDAGYRKPC